jgi:hypothetical protein
MGKIGACEQQKDVVSDGRELLFTMHINLELRKEIREHSDYCCRSNLLNEEELYVRIFLHGGERMRRHHEERTACLHENMKRVQLGVAWASLGLAKAREMRKG